MDPLYHVQALGPNVVVFIVYSLACDIDVAFRLYGFVKQLGGVLSLSVHCLVHVGCY